MGKKSEEKRWKKLLDNYDRDQTKSGNTPIKSTVTKRFPEVHFSSKVKLILSRDLVAEIYTLHKAVGHLEWSGPLFYKILQGDLGAGYKDLVLKACHVFPMDIGTSGFTEYKFGPEILDAYDGNKELEEMKIGHIHTHHSMGTFFSGTDMDELHDNAPNHNFYLSLIVNFAGDYKAKVAFVGERDSQFVYYKGDDKVAQSLDLDKEQVLGVVDCEIEIEHPEYFKTKIGQLQEAKRAKYVTPVQTYGMTPSHYPSGIPVAGNHSKALTVAPLEIRNFFTKWLALDLTAEDFYLVPLKKQNLELASKHNAGGLDQENLTLYLDALENSFERIFAGHFGTSPLKFEKIRIYNECINLLTFHQDIDLAEELIDMFAKLRKHLESPINVSKVGNGIDFDEEDNDYPFHRGGSGQGYFD